MGAGSVAASGEVGARPLGGPSQEPRVPRACSGSAGPSGVKIFKEAVARPDGSNPEDDGEGLEPGLDDEPGSLLDFLNDQRRRVAKSLYQTLPGLSRCASSNCSTSSPSN